MDEEREIFPHNQKCLWNTESDCLFRS